MTLPGPGFIDHIGIGVADLAAAKQYYDELMSVLGLREWFDTGPGGPLNYGPDGAHGSQLFFYQAEDPGSYSRRETGLHHLAFLVASRAVVRAAHEWAQAHDDTILDEPGEFPQYGEHCYATYWLDPHGFKLEAVCHTPEESPAGVGTVAGMDDAVVVRIVSDEPEAQIVCGLLRSAGIECGYRETDAVDAQLEEFTPAGPREILVHPTDLEAARALLDEAPA